MHSDTNFNFVQHGKGPALRLAERHRPQSKDSLALVFVWAGEESPLIDAMIPFHRPAVVFNADFFRWHTETKMPTGPRLHRADGPSFQL